MATRGRRGVTHHPHGGTHCMLCPPATCAVAQSTLRGGVRVSGSRVAPFVPLWHQGSPVG